MQRSWHTEHTQIAEMFTSRETLKPKVYIRNMFKKLRPRNSCRKDWKTPLIEKNNNDKLDGGGQSGNGFDSSVEQKSINHHEDQLLKEQDLLHILAENLGVRLHATPEKCGIWIDAKMSDSDSASANLPIFDLIHMSVHEHLPNQPAEVDKNLFQHLMSMQESVNQELQRLDKLSKVKGYMGDLIDCYYHHKSHHLQGLLPHISSSKGSFVLVQWVFNTYRSEEQLGYPNLDNKDHVDPLVYIKLVDKVLATLFENVQKEVSTIMGRILEAENSTAHLKKEEDFIHTSMDTIQCIDAVLKQAKKISRELYHKVREVCFQELLTFVEKFKTMQKKILEKQNKMATPEMANFIKTLKTCEELKRYIRTEGKDIKTSVLKKNVAVLEETEAFTMKHLLEIAAGRPECHLKTYFKSDKKELDILLNKVKMNFSTLSICTDIQKRVIDEVYKLITQVYLKYLVRHKRTKLATRWHCEVGQRLVEDAGVLQDTMSALAPGVRDWSLMLKKVKDMLDCTEIEAMKLTAADMQEAITDSVGEDQELLRALLLWKGSFSKREVKDVLYCICEHQPSGAFWVCCC